MQSVFVALGRVLPVYVCYDDQKGNELMDVNGKISMFNYMLVRMASLTQSASTRYAHPSPIRFVVLFSLK